MKQQSPALLEVPAKLSGIDRVGFLVFHHAVRNGQLDTISQYVQDFRDGSEPQTSRWLSLASELAGDTGSYDIVVRALGSFETSVERGSPLDRLSEELARQSGSRYQPARLTKTRFTRRLQGLGGHAAHRKELSDAYRFDGTGLKNDARVLVVDDMLATGATLEAIASAIHAELPASVVSGFVLSKAGGPAATNSIDPGYFVSRNPVPIRTGGKVQSAKGETSKAKSRGGHASSSISSKGPQAIVQKPRTGRGITTAMTVIGVLLALVIIGAMGPFHSASKERATDLSNEEIASMIKVAEVPKPKPAEPPAVEPAPVERKNLRPGIVTIPSVGLRKSHSVDAPGIRRAVVRLGEQVEIVKKYAADSGPDWVQVRTRRGELGWVMASTIAEKRR